MKDSPGTLSGTLLQMIIGSWISSCISIAAKLEIPDLLADGPLTLRDLAERTGCNPKALYRVIRALASVGIFEEIDHQTFGSTPMSQYLRKNVPGSVRGFAMMTGAHYHYRSWEQIEHSVRTGLPAFNHVFGKGCFEYWTDHPDESEIFNEAMTSASSQSAAAVAHAYDFSGVQRVMDVSGGHGFLLFTILKSHPHLHGVLFDQPHVVTNVDLDAAGLKDRCECIGGNFFESIPPGCDTYMMRSIIHDWDDERSLLILRNCRKVISENGRLLLIESVVKEPNKPSIAKWTDIEMLIITGGMERTAHEYQQLLKEAGFQITRIIPTSSADSIIEAIPG